MNTSVLYPAMEQSESLGGIYDINTADIYFGICVDGTAGFVPAHKCILATASLKFREMFFESDQTETLPHTCSINALTTFLRSIYCDVFTIKREIIVELTHLAENYDVTKCRTACWEFLDRMIQSAPDDIFQVLSLSIEFKNQEMQRQCLSKWCDVGQFLIGTKAFLYCSCPVLKLVLDTSFFKRDEVKVFLAAIQWARYHCERDRLDPDHAINIRYVLGDCFKSIRFHTMTAHQFVQCQSLHAEVFGADELKSFSKQINQKLKPSLDSTSNGKLQRRFLKSLVNKIENAFVSIELMFGDSKTANVFFGFDSGEDGGDGEGNRWIYAHKCILAAKSPVFKTIFYDNNANPEHYPISDPSYDNFSTFIQLFYHKTVDRLVTADNFAKLISLANAYEAKELVDQCIDVVVKSIDFRNIFRVLDVCFLHSNTDSVNRCLQWIIANEADMNLAFHSNSLVGCNYNTVKFALGRDIPN